MYIHAYHTIGIDFDIHLIYCFSNYSIGITVLIHMQLPKDGMKGISNTSGNVLSVHVSFLRRVGLRRRRRYKSDN